MKHPMKRIVVHLLSKRCKRIEGLGYRNVEKGSVWDCVVWRTRTLKRI